MKPLMVALISALLFTGNQAHAALTCEDIFSKNDELRFVEEITGREHLTMKEAAEFMRAARENEIPVRKLFEEFAKIMRLADSDMALIVTHSNAIRLATTAVKNKVDWPRVRTAIENLLVSTKIYQMANGVEKRLQTPHRTVIALAELAIRYDKSPGQIAFIFNIHAKAAREMKPTEEELHIGLKPIADRALELTIEQLEQQ